MTPLTKKEEKNEKGLKKICRKRFNTDDSDKKK